MSYPTADKVQRLVQLEKTLLRLKLNDEYSDLTIRCGEHAYKVHKNIICPQSAFFQAACKKNGFKEGLENAIKLTAITDPEGDVTADDPEAVRLMIDFFYVQEYTPIREVDKRLTRHCQMYCLGEKYGVEELKKLALAELQPHRLSYGSCTADDFASALQTMCFCLSEGERHIQDLVVGQLLDVGIRHLSHRSMQAAITEVDGLAWELLMRLPTATFSGVSECGSYNCGRGCGILYTCYRCGSRWVQCSKKKAPSPPLNCGRCGKAA